MLTSSESDLEDRAPIRSEPRNGFTRMLTTGHGWPDGFTKARTETTRMRRRYGFLIRTRREVFAPGVRPFTLPLIENECGALARKGIMAAAAVATVAMIPATRASFITRIRLRASCWQP